MVAVKAVMNQMVPSCVEWRGATDNRATTPFGHILQARRFSLFGHIARMPDETDAKISTASPLDALVLQGWRLSNNLSQNETIAAGKLFHKPRPKYDYNFTTFFNGTELICLLTETHIRARTTWPSSLYAASSQRVK